MINIVAPICNTSYGIVAKNFIKHLAKEGLINEIIQIGRIDLTDWPDIQHLIKRPDWVFDGNSYPTLVFWHMHDLGLICNGPKYLYTFFELDRITPEELKVCESYTKVIVASEWAKSVLSQYPSLDGKVFVVPCGYDPDIFFPKTNERDTYRFFNGGKFECRKGHRELIRQFNRVFSQKDNVELWLSTTNKFYPQDLTTYWENLAKHSKLGNKIKLIPWLKTQSDVAKVMQSCDCGVFPSHAEGWNLELSEMIACGKPTIAVNYSAHTEFINKDNCFLIEPTGMELAKDIYGWFKEQGQWCTYNEDDIGNLMRHCFDNNIRTNTGNVNEFTWEKSCQKLVKLF